MNALHAHLIFNHVPIFGLFFGAVLLLASLIFRSRILGSGALLTFIFSGIFAWIVFQTGEAAEETVEHLSGFSEQAIEAHEDAAKPALWLTIVTALVSLVILFAEQRRQNILKAGRYVTLLLALAGFIMMARAGLEGGLIRHTELKAINAPQQEPDNAELNSHESEEE